MSTRRKFIRESARAVAALATGSLLLGCASRNGSDGATTESAPASTDTPNQKDRLGVALLGLGGYAGGQLAPGLQLTEHCYLAGVVTGTPSKIPTWREKYHLKEANCYTYDEMDRIADNPDIDVVYIVTPTGRHAEFAIRAANTGKHVWCEKPMAMDVAECQSIIDACQENGVQLCIGYRMQHEPNTQTVIEYAETKPYGEIQSLRALAGYAGSRTGSTWRYDAELGGGALYDMGVYTINGLRYASGMEPLRVLSAKQDISGEVDVTTEYELEFPGGVRGYGRTSFVESINQLRVDCADGWYELSPMQSYTGVQGRTSDGTLLNKPIEDQQAKQMDDDALAILEGRPVLVPGEDGLRDIRILHAIRESARTGRPVTIG
jgi:glucose-fructose oxidoreductase